MRFRFRALAVALALVLAGAAQAQYAPPPPPGAPPPPPPGAAQPLYQPQQLDQMLASIALYPDPLLMQMLTAATYPLEIDAAAKWVQYPPNAGLSGPSLAVALQGQPWDPSVKSLVPFPQVLAMMDAHLDWTQALGNAFLGQQPDVMDSIQRLRQEAQAAGTLNSGPQLAVTYDGPDILIEPASPQFVYIPIYDPNVAFGVWPYPAYAPFYYGPPPGLRVTMRVGGFGFGVGIGIVGALWHWGDWDWRDHQLHVDPARFNAINVGHPPVTATSWQHAPEHRLGVPYRDAGSRSQFVPPVSGAPDARQNVRGYPSTPQGAAPQGAAPPAQGQPPRQQAPPQGQPPQGQARQPPAPQGQTPQGQPPRQQPPAPQGQPPQGQARQPPAPQGQAPQGQPPQGQARQPPPPQGQTPQGQPPQGQARQPPPPQGQTPQGQPPQGQPRPPAQPQAPAPQARTPSPSPTAFQSYDRGFALVAYPARYGDSGIMTFSVGADGVVMQANLGPRTVGIARAVALYDPDASWKPVAAATGAAR